MRFSLLIAFLFLASCSLAAPAGRLSTFYLKLKSSFSTLSSKSIPATRKHSYASKSTDSNFSLDTRSHEKPIRDSLPSFTPLAFKRLTAQLLKNIKEIIGDPDSSLSESKDKSETARLTIKRIEDSLQFHISEIERDFDVKSNRHGINAYIRSTYISTLTAHAQSFIVQIASLASPDATAFDMVIDLTSVAYVNWRTIKDIIEDMRDEMSDIHNHRRFMEREKDICDVMEIFAAYGEEFMNASRRYVQGVLGRSANESDLKTMERMNVMWGKLSRKKVAKLIMA